MARKLAWERREGESPQAFAAFCEFLRLGGSRSTRLAADKVGKADSLIRRWSVTYNWVDRSTAYDNHLANADVDDIVNGLSTSRDKNLALMDKLRGLLDSRLDTFIERNDDPTIRWTQAVTAMAKIEANSLLLGKEDKTAERVENVMKLLEQALEERGA